MSGRQPDHQTIRAALESAIRAPSVHNTQPWRWRLADTTVHLHADTGRQLPHVDPDGRELLLSCGAALHHLRVAMRASGWASRVWSLPDPFDARHLAAIEFEPAAPDAESRRLARAIAMRRSDRRRYGARKVSERQLAAVMAAGIAPGVSIRAVDTTGEHTRLRRAFAQAGAQHAADPRYCAELASWSGHYADPLGVPARNAVSAADPTVRPFGNPGQVESAVAATVESSRMLLICTASNDLRAWLRAGESTSAVLLEATARGLATCPVTEPLELAETRERIRTALLGDLGYPQLIVRLGWAAVGADPIPATPRLPLDTVLRTLESAGAVR
ncbi:Acg family FMN-binding oxidoreductase [Nocardia crassostreae]|uniref:Acg family FMN-binding oxidoreductase n=1 Tax=Nocardia crassostreae TaxID=53428 RepID=UPI000837723F|nr:NAD(P)H nitroreductase [Nocardia crassostreae]